MKRWRGSEARENKGEGSARLAAAREEKEEEGEEQNGGGGGSGSGEGGGEATLKPERAARRARRKWPGGLDCHPPSPTVPDI